MQICKRNSSIPPVIQSFSVADHCIADRDCHSHVTVFTCKYYLNTTFSIRVPCGRSVNPASGAHWLQGLEHTMWSLWVQVQLMTIPSSLLGSGKVCQLLTNGLESSLPSSHHDCRRQFSEKFLTMHIVIFKNKRLAVNNCLNHINHVCNGLIWLHARVFFRSVWKVWKF